MVYVTDTRRSKSQYGKTYVFGVLQDPSSEGTCMGSGYVNPLQVTTGYRTGRAVKGRDDEHEAELFNITNQADFFGYLKEDEEQYSAQSPYDTGHTFDTVEKRLICTPDFDLKFGLFPGSKPYRYVGPFFANPQYSSQGAFWNVAGVNADYYGPKAIQAVAPTHPLTQLAVGLAEFHSEGARTIGASLMRHAVRGKSSFRPRWRRKGNYLDVGRPSNLKSKPISTGGEIVADEWLNWQFGLKPILSDLQGVFGSMAASQSLLEQYQAGSGKLQHRTYHFPLMRETLFEDSSGRTTGQLSASSPISAVNDYAFVSGNRYGIQTESVVRTTQIWFSGAFTYYLQPGMSLVDDLTRREQEINYLFGTRIDAEALWNLAPWSWLSDWNVNIGTNIANAERLSNDGLVMKYGYLMATTVIDHTIVLNGVALKSGYTGPFTTIFRTTRKQRVKASPFGFSVVPGSFTDRQWSILGALGYTKAPRTLKTV